MLWTNIAQASVMLLLVLAPDGLRTAALIAVSVVVGSCGTLFMVSLRSSIPEMVGEDRRSWANSLSITGRSLAMVAGFASAGVVVSLVGYTAAFVVDTATFAVCAVTVALLPIPGGGKRRDGGGSRGRAPDEAAAAEPGAAGAPARRRGPAALAALAAAPGLALMVALRGVDALGSSSHNAALPVYSSELDDARPAVFVSAFWCLWALGNIVVQQLIQRYARRTGRSVGALGFGWGTCLMSAAFILAFAGFPMVATAAIALVAGAADGLTEVSYTSHLQTLAGRAARPRLRALRHGGESRVRRRDDPGRRRARPLHPADGRRLVPRRRDRVRRGVPDPGGGPAHVLARPDVPVTGTRAGTAAGAGAGTVPVRLNSANSAAGGARPPSGPPAADARAVPPHSRSGPPSGLAGCRGDAVSCPRRRSTRTARPSRPTARCGHRPAPRPHASASSPHVRTPARPHTLTSHTGKAETA